MSVETSDYQMDHLLAALATIHKQVNELLDERDGLLAALRGLRDVHGVDYLRCPLIDDWGPDSRGCGECAICIALDVISRVEGRE